MSLELQVCRDCGTVQYPSRDACRACLSDALERRMTAISGTVLGEATIHRSLDPQGLADGPLRIGAIGTTLGIRIIALLGPGVTTGMAVDIEPGAAKPGAVIAVAIPDLVQGDGPC